MKPIIRVAFICAIVLFSINSYGQRWKNDPSYSPHNYKHPNKAAAAKKAETERLGSIRYMNSLVPVSNNYKAQNLVTRREVKKVQVISGSNNNNLKPQNYKQQFAPTKRR